jgi:hypothetical protein
MGMDTYRHGALYVVEGAKDKNEIQRELKKIDPRLFLEKQITFEQEAVWCVVVDVGSGEPPMTILEFRDEIGKPIPDLSYRIVESMQKMERDGERLAAKVIKQNRAKIDRARADARAHWEEIGKDFEKRMSPTRSAVLPRSQALRRSRDKRRNKGEKI